MELARAEALAGNTLGAENFYQHAKHPLQIDELEVGKDIRDFAATVACASVAWASGPLDQGAQVRQAARPRKPSYVRTVCASLYSP
jgi:hypothetical protein